MELVPHLLAALHDQHSCGRLMVNRPHATCDMCRRTVGDHGVGCQACNFDLCSTCNREHRRKLADSLVNRCTDFGMMKRLGCPVRRRVIDGEAWFVKTWPSDTEARIRGWERCIAIGSIVPPVVISSDRKSVRVKGCILLTRYMLINPAHAIRQRLLRSVDDLQEQLCVHSVAHTDVKPENCVVEEKSMKALLIDADYATNFGQQRVVCTPGLNAPFGAGLSKCDRRTDQMGFDSVRSVIRQG